MHNALSSAARIDYSGLVGQLNSVANAARDAASAISAVPESQTSASGGIMRLKQWMHLAGGGATGTDTIPAMLSPGEFVMSAQATGRFYSQLVAMNSGRAPGHAAGGNVTNAGIVGDVSINVSGGGNKQTAREITTALNREIRRGASRLN